MDNEGRVIAAVPGGAPSRALSRMEMVQRWRSHNDEPDFSSSRERFGEDGDSHDFSRELLESIRARSTDESVFDEHMELWSGVNDLMEEKMNNGCIVEPKRYSGFGPNAHSKYPMLRLMFTQHFKEYGNYAVLHVSYADRLDIKKRRFAWTNGSLFDEGKPAFIFLNEVHVMSMRMTTNNEIVVRDTTIYAPRLHGFWEFLNRTKIFGDMKIVLDGATPQQGMGCGGCGVMSMVNALLPDDCYATMQDAEVFKLPYVESIYDMMLQTGCSPYDLAPVDWRHEALGLIKRWDKGEDMMSWVRSYDVDSWDEHEAHDNEAWNHFARFKIESWLDSCMGAKIPVVKKVMRIYFEGIYKACMNAALPGADLDDMAVYRNLKDLIDLMDRAEQQYNAYQDNLECKAYSDEDVSAESTASLPVGIGRYEKESRTNALAHFCTRVFKLPAEDQLHFANILGGAWTSRLRYEMMQPPHSGQKGNVPWGIVDSLKINDVIYTHLNEELTQFEDVLWPGHERPEWVWDRYGFPQTRSDQEKEMQASANTLQHVSDEQHKQRRSQRSRVSKEENRVHDLKDRSDPATVAQTIRRPRLPAGSG